MRQSMLRAGRAILLLLAAGVGIGRADDLPSDVILLARFKQRVRQDIEKFANCTCLETMERSTRAPGTDAFQFLDRVRLEVTHAGNRELLAWPGGSRFEEREAASFVGGGLVVSGMFASVAHGVFVNDQGTFQYRGTEELEGRQTVRYDFRIPLVAASYKLRSGKEEAVVASRGSFWFDAASLALIRLDELADEIPARLGLAGSIIQIRYAQTQAATGETLLPQSAEIVLTHSDGEVRRNTVQFAHCRAYTAESSISFGDKAPEAKTAQASLSHVDLPAGLTIRTELEDSLDWATAARGDPVRARVVEEVRRGGLVIVPKGATVSGRVSGMERPARGAGFLISLELTEIQWGESRAEFHARLLEVQPAERIKAMRGAQNEAGNMVGLAGSSMPSEIHIEKESGAGKSGGSTIPGMCKLWLKEEQWRITAGMRMVWRSFSP